MADDASEPSSEDLLRSLRASEERFRLLVEKLDVGLVVQDPQAAILLCNPKALELLGLTEDQLLGRTSFDPTWNVIHEDGSDFPGSTHPVVECIRTEKPVRDVVMGVFRPSLRDRVWLLVNAEPQFGVEGALEQVVCTFRDITERKRLEESLRHSQRLESIGHLAAGIAHDFNNLLTVVMTAAEWGEAVVARWRAGEAPDPSHPVLGEFAQILLAAQRASSMTQQLLTFARSDMREEEGTVEVDSLVAELTPFLERMVGPTIRVEVRANAPAANAPIGRTQLEQILVNLVVNARDALPEGGQVDVSTRIVEARDLPQERLSHAAKRIQISVRDDGMGMTEEVRGRIFDPFFTTKPRGRGTGLGLATVYGIVTSAGGSVRCDSAPGRGAEFQIELPDVAHPESRAGTPPSPREPSRGPLRILLVDDDAIVRHQLTRVLEHGGHDVTSVGSAEAALAELESGRRAFDILVTDVVMPGMSGRRLAEIVHERVLDLPVLFVSGYADATFEELGVRFGEVAFLQKPFVAQTLLEAVRNLADDRRTLRTGT